MTALDEVRLALDRLLGNRGAVQNCRRALDEVERAERVVRSLRCRVTDDGNGAASVAPSIPGLPRYAASRGVDSLVVPPDAALTDRDRGVRGLE